MALNLYLISQDVNEDWDTFDFVVVAAKNSADAQRTHPDDDSDILWSSKDNMWIGPGPPSDNPKDDYVHINAVWANANQVTVELIGLAIPGTDPGVICASFNVG